MAETPLLDWPRQQEADDLGKRRAALIRRVRPMKRFSHRRFELEAEIRVLTTRQLAVECGREDPR